MPIPRLNAEEKEEMYGPSWPVSKTSMDTAEKRFKRQLKKCDDARKTARDQCSPVGRVKKGMPEAFERWSLKTNPKVPVYARHHASRKKIVSATAYVLSRFGFTSRSPRAAEDYELRYVRHGNSPNAAKDRYSIFEVKDGVAEEIGQADHSNALTLLDTAIAYVEEREGEDLTEKLPQRENPYTPDELDAISEQFEEQSSLWEIIRDYDFSPGTSDEEIYDALLEDEVFDDSNPYQVEAVKSAIEGVKHSKVRKIPLRRRLAMARENPLKKGLSDSLSEEDVDTITEDLVTLLKNQDYLVAFPILQELVTSDDIMQFHPQLRMFAQRAIDDGILQAGNGHMLFDPDEEYWEEHGEVLHPPRPRVWENPKFFYYNIFVYESFGDTLEFAESLGWVDNFPDSSDPNYSEEMADGIEADALDYIRGRGYKIVESEEG